MPSKSLVCEFCNVEVRKDQLASHCKAKHVKELGDMFIKQLKDKDNHHSVLIDIMKGYTDSSLILVESMAYSNSNYFFGIRPKFFEELDSYEGVNNKEQMAEHYRFLQEVLETIPVTKFLEVNHKQQIVSPEFVTMRKENNKMRKEIDELNKEMRKLKTEYDCLLTTHNEYLDQQGKEELLNEVKIERDEERRRANNAENKCNELENDIRYYKNRMKEVQHSFDEKLESIQRSYSVKSAEQDERLFRYFKEKDEQDKRMEKLNNKIKAEAEKMRMKDKEKEEKEKMKKKLEKKKQEKAVKLAKAKAKLMSDSDSDSSSDSDSE